MNFKILFFIVILYAIYLITLGNGEEAKKKKGKKKTNYTEMAQDMNKMFGGNFTEALQNVKDAEFFKTMKESLKESPATIERHLKEEAHKAFIAYTNARYQHCWRTQPKEIPPEIYLDSIKCASKKLKAAIIKFNDTIHTLVKVKTFANDTYNWFVQCKEGLKSLRNKRGIREFGISMKDKSQRVYKSAKKGIVKLQKYVVRTGKIVGHFVGEKAKIIARFVKENFKKMRTKMSDVSERALGKWKSMKSKICKFGEKINKIYFCIKGAYDVIVNATTLLDHLIDQYKMLEGMDDLVHECVSNKIDSYAPKICSNKFVVPEVSDMDDLIEVYGLKDVPDDFD